MVINKFVTGNIFSAGRGKTPEIMGKLLKIVVKTPNHYPEVRLLVHTSDGELVHDSYMQSSKDVYYPYNIIETLVQDHTETAKFAIAGRLLFTFEGVSVDAPVDFIKFVWEE